MNDDVIRLAMTGRAALSKAVKTVPLFLFPTPPDALR
jgi:hypothetical protein